MPDMTQAKTIVKRYFRTANCAMLMVAIIWLLGAISLIFVEPGAGGWKVFLLGTMLVIFLLLFIPFIKAGSVAWRDCKNNRLCSKKARIVSAQYKTGYRASFSTHIVDSDCERYRIFVKTLEEALALSSWLSDVPATIEYLEGSRIATTVYLEVSPHTMMPSSLAFLLEEREGYTRFIKGKKKENQNIK